MQTWHKNILLNKMFSFDRENIIKFVLKCELFLNKIESFLSFFVRHAFCIQIHDRSSSGLVFPFDTVQTWIKKTIRNVVNETQS